MSLFANIYQSDTVQKGRYKSNMIMQIGALSFFKDYLRKLTSQSHSRYTSSRSGRATKGQKQLPIWLTACAQIEVISALIAIV